jgi:predicted transglutaminase-like cysteine proteinase
VGEVLNHTCAYKGILSGLKVRLQKNRLGDLLVFNGLISQEQLQSALVESKATGRQLGRVLSDQKIVDYKVIRQTLVEQFMLRMMMATLTVFVSFAGFGASSKPARAQLKDVPARMAFQQVAAYAPLEAHPRLFGSSEKKSASLSAFTKWTTMFDRFDQQLNSANGQASMEKFKEQITALQGLPMNKMVSGVNDIVNRVRYINDINIYGKTDYWATPVEFLANGGDCEDYAITKYVALRALGIPENRMRILILQDLQKNIPHAVLVVYTDNGAMILDNQFKTMMNAERISHYKPIFSINRTAWWLHTKPAGNDVTVVASSSR